MDAAAAGRSHDMSADGWVVLSDDDDVLVSFEAFYAEHHLTLARALAVTLRDEHLAADAAAEAMARAYQRWARVRDLANPAGWVYSVGLNWSRSLLRRTMRLAPIWVRHPPRVELPPVADPALDRALRELSIEQRAVVVCRHLIGLSEAETAEALGVRVGTVKSRTARALQRLRDELADDQPEPDAPGSVTSKEAPR